MFLSIVLWFYHLHSVYGIINGWNYKSDYSFFALIVSLGMLVDAAIIVIENIHRHKNETPNMDISIISINATNEIEMLQI